MKRRDFSKQLVIAGGGVGLSTFIPDSTQNIANPNIIPEALKKGDTVGIIAPASSFPPERIPKTEANMAALGLKVKWAKNLYAQNGYLAGKDKQRLKDIHKMFKDSDVKAIWCIRGGYGCSRLLPDLDYELIKENPKILIGYSDVTALLNAIHQRTGLVCFHGPVGSSTFSEYTLTCVRRMLFEPLDQQSISLSHEQHEKDEPGFETYVIRKGKASGRLVGGNLSLLSAMTGTQYQIDVKDRLLFIEDVGEKPYRIDRMLTQLRQALPLEEAAGIVLGVFADCQPGEKDRSLSLQEALEDRLHDLKIPVSYGFSFGHITDQCTFPIGIEARMDTKRQLVEILEPVVQG